METRSLKKDQKNSYGGTTAEQIESTTTSEQKCQKCHREEDSNTIKELPSTSNPSAMNKMSQQSQAFIGLHVLSTSSSPDTYDALCQHCQGQCHCRQQQLWTTSKWRPDNWPQWPLIKKVLIGTAIFALLTWLLVYLILHFYLEAKDSDDDPE